MSETGQTPKAKIGCVPALLIAVPLAALLQVNLWLEQHGHWLALGIVLLTVFGVGCWLRWRGRTRRRGRQSRGPAGG